jgi:hypothetical protein
LLPFSSEFFVLPSLFINLKIKVHKTIILSVVSFLCETFVTQKEEHRRRMLANRVTKKIFVREIDEVSGG